MEKDLKRSNIEFRALDREKCLRELNQLQVAIYTMCGGGFLGQSAAVQPKDFYVDARVRSLPYPKTKILKVAETISIYAEALGLDEPLDFDYSAHNCGVW